VALGDDDGLFVSRGTWVCAAQQPTHGSAAHHVEAARPVDLPYVDIYVLPTHLMQAAVEGDGGEASTSAVPAPAAEEAEMDLDLDFSKKK
jgi:hypothetical protein